MVCYSPLALLELMLIFHSQTLWVPVFPVQIPNVGTCSPYSKLCFPSCLWAATPGVCFPNCTSVLPSFLDVAFSLVEELYSWKYSFWLFLRVALYMAEALVSQWEEERLGSSYFAIFLWVKLVPLLVFLHHTFSLTLLSGIQLTSNEILQGARRQFEIKGTD